MVLAALDGALAALAGAFAALAVAGFAAALGALADDGDDALAVPAAALADAAVALVILLGVGDGDLFGDFLRAAELNILLLL